MISAFGDEGFVGVSDVEIDQLRVAVFGISDRYGKHFIGFWLDFLENILLVFPSDNRVVGNDETFGCTDFNLRIHKGSGNERGVLIDEMTVHQNAAVGREIFAD